MITRLDGRGFLSCSVLACLACFTTAQAGSLGGTAEENQKAIDACKSPAQHVTYVVASSPQKALDAPVTADEDKRVRNVMAAAGVTYDPVKRRATFQMVLDLVRANGVIRFTITPSDGSIEFNNTKNCLASLANDIGAGAEFVSSADASDADESKIAAIP
jgi:hypothetical protein